MASSSLAVPQTTNSSTDAAYPNGNLSTSIAESNETAVDSPSGSAPLRDSETSAHPSPRPDSANPSKFDEVNVTNDEDSELSDTMSNEDASGDAEFEFDSPAVTPAAANGQSSSSDERRPAKRKASGIEDDEAIMANPELYGIRRSGRARPTTRIIDTSDESDSDIAAKPRKRRKRTPAEQESPLSSPSPSASDSDSDVYATSRRKASKKKGRSSRASASPAGPVHAELRFSTRKAAKVSNYNEDDDDDEFEEDDETTPGYWVTAEEDNRPAIDCVLNHRKSEDVNPEKLDPGKADFEYFIKWQGKAYYHATWEKFSDLNQCRGIRRLENYFRKIVLEDIHMQQDDDVPPEDKEKWSLDRERENEAINDHTKVERVIDVAETEEGTTQYLIKWRGLNYDSCTWEDEELVSQIAQDEIDRYLDRSARLPSSDRKESSLNTRTEHRANSMKEQPEAIKFGTLRDFQLYGLNWLCHSWSKGNSVILADEMGLGKTIQTIAFMSWLKNLRRQEGPFLVVVPLSTMPAWAEALDNWTPDMNYVVYNGNEAARQVIREKELLINNNPLKIRFNVLLTTYEYILADSAFLGQLKWQFLAVDEAHRLKNRESQLYVKLRDFKAPARLLITGTPVQNNLEELSALMDFVAPGVVHIDESVDMQSEGASKMIAEVTEKIKPYIMRRTKTKVENDLPPKTEKIIRVELSDIQLEYYRNILTRNYAALNQGSKGQKQSLLNIMMELKKASNHPFMFPQAEDRILAGSERRDDVLKGLITSSGKMMLLDRLLSKLQKDGHRVLIFSQMVRMLDILSDYLRLRGYTYQRLDGNIAAGARRAAIDHFNAPDSNDFCFLLSTRAGGLGINLMTADTVVLFDSDWNPQADLQAMARAHRIGQTRPVSIYRLVSKETVEEEVLERARNKLMLEFITIQRGITDKEARELNEKMVKAGKGVAEPTSSEDISRILKRRGQKMFEQTGNQKKLEELDIDAVLENAEEHKTDQPEGFEADGGEDFLKSFEYVDVKVDLEWDDIIPKEQLEEIKAEEKRKADQQFLDQMIEDSKPRKRKADSEREERAAKKRARDLAALEVADESEPERVVDPMRPLSERETRNLVRGYLRYGDIDDRPQEVIREARLENRDTGLLKSHLQKIKDTANQLQKDSDDRIKAQEAATQKSVTKKDRKAVLFDFNGVKRLNAETIIERPGEMRMLRDETGRLSDARTYRVLGAQKGAQYSCEWGAREDGMLCVGIARHGYGAWPQIRDDVDLGLKDKFFLEEHRVDKKEERKHTDTRNIKSPGAVHLVRRADYLLSVLKERLSGGTNAAASRAVANHHRNHKRNTIRQEDHRGSSMSHSPAPGTRKPHRDNKLGHRHRTSSDRRMSNGDHSHDRHRHDRQSSHPRHRTSENGQQLLQQHNQQQHQQQQEQQNGSGDGVVRTGLIRMAMDRVMANLQKVKNATKDKVADKTERAALLRCELVEIGDFITGVMMKSNEIDSRLESDVWNFVAGWWPNPNTAPDKIRDMYYRIAASRDASANGGDKAQKKPETPSNQVQNKLPNKVVSKVEPPKEPVKLNGLMATMPMTHSLPPRPPPPASS